MKNIRRGSDLPLTQAECDRVKLLFGMYDWNTVCELAKIGSATLAKLRNRDFKAAKRALRPMPSDFKLIADGMSMAYLCDRYKCSTRAIIRWRQEAGFSPVKDGAKPIPIPDDFASVYPTLQVVEVARHYGVNPHTVRKWQQRTGLPGKVTAPSRIGWAEERYRRIAQAA